jgi:outer membrane receptor for ferrienterochelin and colicins
MTPDFFDLGIKAAYDFKFCKSTVFQLNAGIQNIFQAYQKDFDRGANRDSNYIRGEKRCVSKFSRSENI